MGDLTGEKLHQFLQGRFIASLATENDDGSIHLAAVWYIFEGDTFLVATTSSTRKARNVLARPKASLMVDARTTELQKGTTAICTVEVIHGEESRAINHRIHGRYLSAAALADPAVGPAFADMDDMTLRLVPQRWIDWDMAELDAQAFGGVFRRNPDYMLPPD
ncbi:MAG: pyridoxamine 5'-phosphate oxidase family protein [Candidatus Acidiferrales bacterium]